MSYARLINLNIISLFLLFLSFGCAEVNDVDVIDGTEKSFGSFGNAASIVYSCEVATIDSYGSTWRYQTKEIMNLMGQINLTVSRDSDVYGSFALNRIDTDTFSDGNLTVKLVQMGAMKSIAVNHVNTSLYARAENGWCSATQSDRYANGSGNTWNQPADQNTWGGSAGGTYGGYDQFKVQVSPECPNPCAFSVKTNMNVARVEYQVDQWIIGDSYDANNGFATVYNFNQAGQRTLTVTGYDARNNFVARDSAVFISGSATQPTNPDVQDSQNGRVLLNVPYYYQYANALNQVNSCQNSSVAMVLSYYGVNITPDDITREFGKDRAQQLNGLNEVFNTLASRYGVRGIDSSERGTLEQVKRALDSGRPVIVHGFFTDGHVVVIVGYDETGYYVNDPAGTWNEVFKGGYPNAWNEPTAGHAIHYSKDAFERAIMTWDGRTFDSAYLHIPR